MTASRKTLILIDGHALAYRTYFALTAIGGDNSRWTTKTGEPTAGTYGFASVLLNILERDRPDYLAVSFDVGGTFRDELFPEYKGTREKMPDELSVQIERIMELVRIFRIPVLTAKNYEADDVLGTVARRAAEQGVAVKIVTGDRDLLQLATDDITINLSGQKLSEAKDYGPAEVQARFGLTPQQYIQFKALVGDKSDNIPGVAGVGEKTATELIQKYGSIENIYAHLDEVPNRFRTKLEAGREMAELSLKLSTIVTDVPLDFTLEACVAGQYDRQEVVELFRVLEFNSLLRRLPEGNTGEAASEGEGEQLKVQTTGGDETAAPTGQMALFGAPEGGATTHPIARPAYVPTGPATTETICVTDEAGLQALVQVLNQAPFITFDVETTSTDEMQTKLVGIALAVKEGQGYYIPVGHTGEDPGPQLPVEQVIQAIAPAMTNPRIPKYGHNLKFDYIVLARYGLRAAPLSFDTMVAEWLCDPASHSLGLKKLAFVRLGVEMTEITELIGTGRKQLTMDVVPVAACAPYAAADVDMTTRLKPILEAELIEKGQLGLFTEMEMPLLPILAEMEMTGISLDTKHLAGMAVDLQKKLDKLEKAIYKEAGMEFNINSTQQLSDVLFGKLNIKTSDRSRKTAAGKYSTAADVLEELRSEHKIIELILEQRELSKLKSTYVDALPQAVNPETGRVHTTYKQTGSVTGRIASEAPNLQNIPIRTELGREVRKAFVAGRGRRLVAADYSQIELRVAAHVSKDPTLLEAFRRGEDIHAATAAAVLGVPADKITKDQRRIAKCVGADTLVYSSAGLQTIGSLGSGMEPGEYRPLQIHVATDRGLKQATHIYFDGIQAVVRIRTKGGLELTCTADHKLRVVDEAGEYAWRRAADLSAGDFVALAKKPAIFGHHLDLPAISWPDELKATNFQDIALPTQWTAELARLLGYIVSEGYIHRDPRMTYGGELVLSQDSSEVETVEDIRTLCKQFFGNRASERIREGHIAWRISSSKLVFWLQTLGVGHNSSAKALPLGLLSTPQSIQIEFLRTLFTGDGSLKSGGRELTYCTKSPILARQLQQMLLNFGFRFSLVAESRRDYPDPYYVLRLGGVRQLEAFMQQIGFVSPRKTQVTPAITYDLTHIPNQQQHVKELYPLLHGVVREKAYEVLRPVAPVRLNRARTELIIGQLRQTGVTHASLEHLQSLLELELDFIEVEAVSADTSPVYDLVVPDGHSYIANGFVSHNTINFGVLYGQGAFGLTRTTGFTLAEAEAFIKSYFERLPGLKAYIDDTKRRAAEVGYVESLLGRRRYFPGLTQPANTREGNIARARAEREAINAPIQATAADIIKRAMLRLPDALKEAGLEANLLLQVHDELVLECRTGDVKAVAAVLCEVMENAFTLDIPLGVDVRAGSNWEEMKAVKVKL